MAGRRLSFETSNTSSITPRSRVALRRMTSTCSRTFGSSVVSLSSSANPRIEVIGVRSSCVTLATKSTFCWVRAWNVLLTWRSRSSRHSISRSASRSGRRSWTDTRSTRFRPERLTASIVIVAGGFPGATSSQSTVTDTSYVASASDGRRSASSRSRQRPVSERSNSLRSITTAEALTSRTEYLPGPSSWRMANPLLDCRNASCKRCDTAICRLSSARLSFCDAEIARVVAPKQIVKTWSAVAVGSSEPAAAYAPPPMTVSPEAVPTTASSCTATKNIGSATAAHAMSGMARIGTATGVPGKNAITVAASIATVSPTLRHKRTDAARGIAMSPNGAMRTIADRCDAPIVQKTSTKSPPLNSRATPTSAPTIAAPLIAPIAKRPTSISVVSRGRSCSRETAVATSHASAAMPRDPRTTTKRGRSATADPRPDARPTAIAVNHRQRSGDAAAAIAPTAAVGHHHARLISPRCSSAKMTASAPPSVTSPATKTARHSGAA